MTALRIEVAAGAIEADGQKRKRVEAVLLSISLGLCEQHFLGKPYDAIAVPDFFFAKRTGANFGYEQIDPTSTIFSTPVTRAWSISSMPMLALSKKKRSGFSGVAPIPPTIAAR